MIAFKNLCKKTIRIKMWALQQKPIILVVCNHPSAFSFCIKKNFFYFTATLNLHLIDRIYVLLSLAKTSSLSDRTE